MAGGGGGGSRDWRGSCIHIFLIGFQDTCLFSQSKCIHAWEGKQTGKMLALRLVSSWEMPKELFVPSHKYQGFFIVELWCSESGGTFPWQLIDVVFIYWLAGNDSVSSWHFSFFLFFFSPVKICFSGWKWQQHLPFYLSESLWQKVNSSLIWFSYSMKHPL